MVTQAWLKQHLKYFLFRCYNNTGKRRRINIVTMIKWYSHAPLTVPERWSYAFATGRFWSALVKGEVATSYDVLCTYKTQSSRLSGRSCKYRKCSLPRHHADTSPSSSCRWYYKRLLWPLETAQQRQLTHTGRATIGRRNQSIAKSAI